MSQTPVSRMIPKSPGAALCLSNNFFSFYFSSFGALIITSTNLTLTCDCFACAVSLNMKSQGTPCLEVGSKPWQPLPGFISLQLQFSLIPSSVAIRAASAAEQGGTECHGQHLSCHIRQINHPLQKLSLSLHSSAPIKCHNSRTRIYKQQELLFIYQV